MINLISFLKRIKRSLCGLRDDCLFHLYRNLFRHASLQSNKIIFNNFNGRGYGDNPKYIAEELLRREMPYDLVWVVNRKQDPTVPKAIRTVRAGSWREAYEYATAKVIVNNVKSRLPFHKKKEQYYIQTWHGCFALKRIEGEVENELAPIYVRYSQRDSAMTDVMLSGSSMISDIMRRYFWYSGEIFECGQPRDDIFFSQTEDEIKELKMKYGIPVGTKVAVYAPTFGDNRNTSAYKEFDAHRFRDCLVRKTGKQWMVIVRLHPNVAFQDSLFRYDDTVLNGSQGMDGQELFLLGDLLVTDFSSVMMDFAIMKKPVFLFTPDLDEYRKDRGLRPLFDTLPFPRCMSQEALDSAVLSYDKSSYLENLHHFMETSYKNYSDGHASERVAERIKQVIDGTFTSKA